MPSSGDTKPKPKRNVSSVATVSLAVKNSQGVSAGTGCLQPGAWRGCLKSSWYEIPDTEQQKFWRMSMDCDCTATVSCPAKHVCCRLAVFGAQSILSDGSCLQAVTEASRDLSATSYMCCHHISPALLPAGAIGKTGIEVSATAGLLFLVLTLTTSLLYLL